MSFYIIRVVCLHVLAPRTTFLLKLLEILTKFRKNEPTTVEQEIIIEKEYEPNLPEILCEGTKIQQVLLNILTNGAQAMAASPPGTQPKFIIRLSHDTQKRMLCMEIEDNGPGIELDVKKRIFEPFFTTKPVGVGTGLGLSVSYFIITKNHNGTLEVESQPGQGARFIIRLPRI